MDFITSSIYVSKEWRVWVRVVEGRNVRFRGAETQIVLKVGRLLQVGAPRTAASSPYYGQEFTFEFKEELNSLLNKTVILSVHQARRCLPRGKALGTADLDLATIWCQPDHQVVHKWAVLWSESLDGPAGFMLVDLAVLGRGDSLCVPITGGHSEHMMENLLAPPWAGRGVEGGVRTRATYFVRIYRAEGLPLSQKERYPQPKESIPLSPVAGQENENEPKVSGKARFKVTARFVGTMAVASQRRARERAQKQAKCKCKPRYSVRVSFAGKTLTTSARGCPCKPPVWSEQLVFKEMFPPLHQRVRLQLLDNNHPLAEYCIEMHRVCQVTPPGGDGVLFGPRWLGFEVHPQKGSRKVAWGCKGKLLASVVTSQLEHEVPKKHRKQIKEFAPKIEESSVLQYADMVLMMVIWDIFLLNKKILNGRQLGMEISLGSAGDSSLWQHRDLDVSSRQIRYSRCQGLLALSHDGIYSRVDLGNRKVVLTVRAHVPDLFRDLRVDNVLDRLATLLNLSVRSAERSAHPESVDQLLSTLTSVKRRLDILARQRVSDQYRRKLKALMELAEAAQAASAKEEKDKGARLSVVCDRLRNLGGRLRIASQDWDCGSLTIFVWLTDSAKRRCALATLPARAALYSRTPAQRGRHSGKLHTLQLSDERKRVLGLVESMVWLSARHDAHLSLQGLPGGHNADMGGQGSFKFQHNIVYQQAHNYECVADIFHGRFVPGADESGLGDPFIRVVFGPHSATTQVIPESLVPSWSRTVRVPQVRVCGNPEDVRSRPPVVVVEAWDKDVFGSEFLGRALIRPRVLLCPPSVPKDEPLIQLGDTRDVLSSLQCGFNVNLDLDPKTNIESKQEIRAINQPSSGKGNFSWINKISSSKSTTSTQNEQVKEAPKKTSKIIEQVKDMQWIKGIIRRGVSRLKSTSYFINETTRSGIQKIASLRQSRQSQHTSKLDFIPGVDDEDPVEDENELRWLPMVLGSKRTGDVLARVQLVQVPEGPDQLGDDPSAPHPELLNLELTRYRLEVLFWGLREVRGHSACNVGFQYVTVECAGQTLTSCRLDPSKSFNFQEPYQFMDIELPVSPEWMPALHVKLYRRHVLGLFRRYMATHLLPSAAVFLRSVQWAPVATELGKRTEDEPGGFIPVNNERRPKSEEFVSLILKSSTSTVIDINSDSDDEIRKNASIRDRITSLLPEGLLQLKNNVLNRQSPSAKKKKGGKNVNHSLTRRHREIDPDWWTRYYATLESIAQAENQDAITRKFESDRVDPDLLLEIYNHELEHQKEFEGFQDFLQTLELRRGKRDFVEGDDSEKSDDEEMNALETEASLSGKVVAKLKCSLELHRLDVIPSASLIGRMGTLWRSAGLSSRSRRIVVRLYVVRAHALPPKDASGLSDPYLVVQFGRQEKNDRKNKIDQTLNPIFGRVFEFEGEFPRDHTMTIRVMDWDKTSSDDFIGETTIDLENRFFSRHLGGCGIQRRYQMNGQCAWRDSRLPSQILQELCECSGLPAPSYKDDKVYIGDWTPTREEPNLQNAPPGREQAALSALQSWPTLPGAGCHLVPQHVETRSLLNPRRPGVEQGQLEMWVDILAVGLAPLPPPVPFAVPPPGDWELRIVVIQADSVIGTEWISGLENESQSTDVHFSCSTGEALFNWRFVLKFSYDSAEDRVVTSKGRFPARLNMLVMDYDTFTRNDVLGTLSLDLSRVPRGAAHAVACKLPRQGESRPVINLFLAKRAYGWWPAVLATDSGTAKARKSGLAGKLQLEMNLMSAHAAERNPIGRGREGPEPLPKPNRPADAISFFRHPLLGLYYHVWRRNRRRLLMLLPIILLVLFTLSAVFAVPSQLVKKLIGS